ncbi:uncharacterized protein [Rutidosis leptorrhynchoides]|uniref:uncharacterized protein n=1 Tax=Rutidosis leptorrhynchoides TaxID=125765 RepID=UPI003A9937B0
MEVDTSSQASNMMVMEVSSRRSRSTQPFEVPRNETKNSPGNNESSTPAFFNQGVIAWNEGRRRWIGDQSQKPQRLSKDPIISWSTTYDDLLSTSKKFTEPIPLSEMVDFLVDIWHNEGLYD